MSAGEYLALIFFLNLALITRKAMAPLPKRRHSTRRGGKRQAAWLKAFTIPGFTKCPQCGMLRVPHRVCKACGSYNGKIVVVKKTKTKKK